MKTDRRKFIETTVAGGLAATLPGTYFNQESLKAKYSKLDEIMKKPVLKAKLFQNPVIIDTLELLRYKNTFLCRVRSKDGALGIAVANNAQMKSLWPVFVNR